MGHRHSCWKNCLGFLKIYKSSAKLTRSVLRSRSVISTAITSNLDPFLHSVKAASLQNRLYVFPHLQKRCAGTKSNDLKQQDFIRSYLEFQLLVGAQE